jgi:hypothetical protein
MQLTAERARSIVTPLYEALNEPGKKDIKALLEQTTTPDFLSCGNEGECVGRDAVVASFTALGQTIPHLHWTIKNLGRRQRGDRARRSDRHACSSVSRTRADRKELSDNVDRHPHDRGR